MYRSVMTMVRGFFFGRPQAARRQADEYTKFARESVRKMRATELLRDVKAMLKTRRQAEFSALLAQMPYAHGSRRIEAEGAQLGLQAVLQQWPHDVEPYRVSIRLSQALAYYDIMVTLEISWESSDGLRHQVRSRMCVLDRGGFDDGYGCEYTTLPLSGVSVCAA